MGGAGTLYHGQKYAQFALFVLCVFANANLAGLCPFGFCQMQHLLFEDDSLTRLMGFEAQKVIPERGGRRVDRAVDGGGGGGGGGGDAGGVGAGGGVLVGGVGLRGGGWWSGGKHACFSISDRQEN